MRPLAFAAAGLALGAVQAVLLRWIGGGAVPLQLLVPCIAWLALEAESVEGVLASAGIGFAMDLFAGGGDGIYVFAGVLAFLCARALGIAVDLRARVGFAVLTGAACLLVSLGTLLLQRWAGAPEASPGAALLPRALGEAFLTAAASPLVWMGMKRLGAALGREEQGLVP